MKLCTDCAVRVTHHEYAEVSTERASLHCDDEIDDGLEDHIQRVRGLSEHVLQPSPVGLRCHPLYRKQHARSS